MNEVLNKLHVMAGNKQTELNALYRRREELDKQIARAEGELSGLRDAHGVADKAAKPMETATH